MKWIKFVELNGDSLYLRREDVYKVVKANGTGNLHIYTVEGIKYECKAISEFALFKLLENKT